MPLQKRTLHQNKKSFLSAVTYITQMGGNNRLVCNGVHSQRYLNFNPQREVNSRLRSVDTYRPASKETLKKEQPELHNLLVKNNIV